MQCPQVLKFLNATLMVWTLRNHIVVLMHPLWMAMLKNIGKFQPPSIEKFSLNVDFGYITFLSPST